MPHGGAASVAGRDLTSARPEGEMDALLLGRTRDLKVWGMGLLGVYLCATLDWCVLRWTVILSGA